MPDKTLNISDTKISRLVGELLDLIKPAAGILFLAITAAAAVSLARPSALSWSWRPGEIQEGLGVVEITDLEVFFRLKDSPQAVLLDAREALLYDIGHIPGAVSLPAEDAKKVPSALEALLPNWPSEPVVIAYCSEEFCPLAGRLAEILTERGFGPVYVFRPGFDVWLESGYPVEKTE
jgi:rhodanese-related sulfurtransferase